MSTYTVDLLSNWQRLLQRFRTARQRAQAHEAPRHRALSMKVKTLLDAWQLDRSERAALLGLTDIPADDMLPGNPDTIARAGHLLDVDKALHERFRERPYFRDRWIGLAHARLRGRTPLETMQRGGAPEMQRVCAILRGQATDFDSPVPD